MALCPLSPGRAPSRRSCYIVEAFKGESKDVYFPHDTSIQIKYHPGDTIWDPVTYREKERKRRVPWFFYSDEVINFDEISYEEADYYMKCRLDRTGYIRMLPTLHWIKYIKLQEKALEDEFSKMIAGQLGWEMNDDNEKRSRKLSHGGN